MGYSSFIIWSRCAPPARSCITPDPAFVSLQPLSPVLAKFRHFGKLLKVFVQFSDGLLSIWKPFVPTLAFLCNWPNCHCCKWPKIEQYYKSLRRLWRAYLVLGKKFPPALVNILCHWVIFHCCKWPNINK